MAIDGKTPKAERREAIERFTAGQVQFLLNFGVFTEGFDCPAAEVCVMARPTKSRSLYEQMLGRVLRPGDGVVDPHPTAEARKAAIAASSKPIAHVLDFVGNSRHKLVSSVDVLGGNYSVEIRQLAEKELERKGGDPALALKKAAARFAFLVEEAERKTKYETQHVDPFGTSTVSATGQGQKRGGATDGQVQFLVNLGVENDTAIGYGRRQASVVIDKLKQERCTVKQKKLLAKHGFNPDVPFDAARKIIDEIVASGWTLRGDLAEA